MEGVGFGVVMCREPLARHGEIGLNGADVLEVGAGAASSALAARLGARGSRSRLPPRSPLEPDKSVELNAEASVGCELRRDTWSGSRPSPG